MNFDELTPDVQKDLINLMMKGKKPTPENQNRARAALQANPNLVKRLLQENDLAEAEDPDKDGDDDTSAAVDTDDDAAEMDDDKLGLKDD